MSKIDFLKGNWFVFQEGENKIALFLSSFSGKEIVFINGLQVSESRSYRAKTNHIFSYGGSSYELKFHLPKIFSGRFSCSLIKNDCLTETQETVHRVNHLAILKAKGQILTYRIKTYH